jgi:hypothetical protein
MCSTQKSTTRNINHTQTSINERRIDYGTTKGLNQGAGRCFLTKKNQILYHLQLSINWAFLELVHHFFVLVAKLLHLSEIQLNDK